MKYLIDKIKSGELELSNSWTCPVCGKKNFCGKHKHIYRNWFMGTREGFKK